MAVIVLTSAGGSPGVTSTALGLSLTWPRPVLLADCDRHPNQAVLAGYLRGLSAGGRGLGGLVQEYRSQTGDGVQQLLGQTVQLDDDPVQPRRFLPGFTNPGSALLFEHYWPRLAGQLAELHQTDVLVDAGRLDADGLPGALVERASQVLVLSRAGLPAVATLRLFLPDLIAGLDEATKLGLVVVGGGRPYSATEISDSLGVRLVADLPWDPATAAVLSEGDPPPRRLRERPLWRGYQALSSQLQPLGVTCA